MKLIKFILLALISTGITAQVTDTIVVGEQGILIKGIKGDRGPMGPKGDTDTIYSITRDTVYIIGLPEPIDPTPDPTPDPDPTGNPAFMFIDTTYVGRVERTWIQVKIETQDFCQAVAWFSEDGFEYPKVNKGRKEESFNYKNHSLRIGYNSAYYGTGFPLLKPNTTYYIRVYVTTKDGKTYGSRELIAKTKI